jgi:hypothetical protein
MMDQEGKENFMQRLAKTGSDLVEENLAQGIYNGEKSAIAKLWLGRQQKPENTATIRIDVQTAESKLHELIEKGKTLLTPDPNDIDFSRSERDEWSKNAIDSLSEIFLDDNIPKEFRRKVHELKQAHENYGIIKPDINEQAQRYSNFMIGILEYLTELLAILPSASIGKSVPTPVPFPVQEYVDNERIETLRSIESEDFDLSKLIRLCEEINIAYSNECFLLTIMGLRSILDHLPPILGFKTFGEVANNYNGSKSFKDQMQALENFSRKIADLHLHTPIRSKDDLPTKTQVNFSNALDTLLGEIIIRLYKSDDSN